MNVVIASGDQDLRLGVELVVTKIQRASVVGSAAEAEGVLALLGIASPDLLILDWRLPSADGPKVIASARTLAPGVSVLVLGHRSGERGPALDAGADDFVVIGRSPEALTDALKALARTAGS